MAYGSVGKRWRAIGALAGTAMGLAEILAGGAPRAAGAPAQSWRGWDRYQAIMWSTGSARDVPAWISRLQEMGCTAEEVGPGGDPGPMVQNHFGFYVENLVSDLGFLNRRQSIYDEDFRGYTSTRDKRFLTRKPCFDDPAFWEGREKQLADLVRPYVGARPLLYNLRDELSVGSYASPMDYCFCPHTLQAFRAWLRTRYGSLEALNAEWDTRFGSWDAVTPLTTYESKDRERAALAAGRPENYAPWADHREYMDVSLAETLARLRAMIRKLDPATPVGIEGTQMPSAWGGYDLWRLSQAVDWVEPYDIANSREIFRSFLPPGAPVLGTVFGSDFRHVQWELWRLLLEGDRGCIIWDDENSRCVQKDTPGMALTPRAKGLTPILAELKRVAPQVMPLTSNRIGDGIAIHYSQASIRAHWMFDSREDKDTWPRRFSSYEASHSRLARVRDSFVRVVEDLGLQHRFVSYEQLEKGQLASLGCRVLLLPQSVAMSRAECQQVRAFVQAGGTVIADNMTATMDEHCKRLPAGQLDDLFGIRRTGVGWREQGEAGTLPLQRPGAIPLRAYEPDLLVTTGKALRAGPPASPSVPVVVENQVGHGRAIYLNLDLHGYGRDRLQPGRGAETADLFRALLARAGVKPYVAVTRVADGTPLPCAEVWRYRGRGIELIAVLRSPEAAADSLGEVGYTGNQEIEKPEKVRVTLPAPREVRNLRTGQELGRRTAGQTVVDTVLDPWSPLLLECRIPPK